MVLVGVLHAVGCHLASTVKYNVRVPKIHGLRRRDWLVRTASFFVSFCAFGDLSYLYNV